MTTIKIFDAKMKPLAELDIDVARLIPVEPLDQSKDHWVQGCAVSIKIDDPACTEENFKYGNFVEIDGKLGTIWTPRAWSDGWLTTSINFEPRGVVA